jgi:hypothetical protein
LRFRIAGGTCLCIEQIEWEVDGDRQTMTDRGRSDVALCTVCFCFPDFAAAMFEIDLVISSFSSRPRSRPQSHLDDLISSHLISPLTPWHENDPQLDPLPLANLNSDANSEDETVSESSLWNHLLFSHRCFSQNAASMASPLKARVITS